jgi:hypothetical protein
MTTVEQELGKPTQKGVAGVIADIGGGYRDTQL